MRYPYIRDRLAEAAAALDEHPSNLRDALYAAHLRLHTLLPEHFPEGALREEFGDIHARLTKRRREDRGEASVIEVIHGLEEADAAALATRIRRLHEEVRRIPPVPAEARPAAQPSETRAPRPAGAPGAVAAGPALVLFGSTEGHTARLAEFVARVLAEDGREVHVRQASRVERALDPGPFGLAVIAASIHWGRYQASITEFVRANHDRLNETPSAFISVSLTAAGVPQPEGPTLEDYLRTFEAETLWTPWAVHHAAGAIGRSGYDYFKRLAATLIARSRGESTPAAGAYDLTDYEALSAFVLDFARRHGAAGPARAMSSPRRS